MRFGSIGLIAACLIAGAGSAIAQSPRPPAGYAGREWTDPNGCIYVRAQMGGETVWAARLDRDRHPVCGGTRSGTVAATPAAAAAVPASTIQPRRVRPFQIVTNPAIPKKFAVPPGYKLAWGDDRLNPDRGPRSAEGNAATDRIWTQTTPRRLIGK